MAFTQEERNARREAEARRAGILGKAEIIPPGWHLDSDYWLVRPLRGGDRRDEWWWASGPGGNGCHGFCTEHNVYARSVTWAQKFDRR